MSKFLKEKENENNKFGSAIFCFDSNLFSDALIVFF